MSRYKVLLLIGASAFLRGRADAQATSGSAAPLAAPNEIRPSEAAAPQADETSDPDAFKRYDALALKGWEIPFPKTADTILADEGGIRDFLAGQGIGILATANNTLQYDALQNDRGYKGPKLYNGQNITRTSSSASLYATFDTGRLGVPNGQISTTLEFVSNSFKRVDGPHAVRISRLNYFQSLWNDKVEVKLGITDNSSSEFLGLNVGGSLAAGSLGPQGTIPYEVGLSYGGFGTPAISIRVSPDGRLYNKVEVQRSLPPGGATAEYMVNHSGFRFAPPGTGVFTIDEFGYKRPAAPGDKSIWLRAGGMYNTTNYRDFDTGENRDNWAVFFAIDRQLTQIDSTKPFRGLYVGATYNRAPADVDFVCRYWEGRIYGIGLVPGRPFDLASLVASYSGYSSAGLRAKNAPGDADYRETISAVASYAYRMLPGLYLQPGVGVTIHPIYSPIVGPALNLFLSTTALF